MFSIYRIISIPGSLKLETITTPYRGSEEFLKQMSTWLLENSKQLVSPFVKVFTPETSLGLAHILKASPSARVSFKGFLTDCLA